MAEKNNKLSPFEKEQAEVAKLILEYKLGSEASIVAMIYKNPDLLRETNLQLNDIHNNCWRVYFEIASIRHCIVPGVHCGIAKMFCEEVCHLTSGS